eukprot:766058-Hanusia_phi.AAC.9
MEFLPGNFSLSEPFIKKEEKVLNSSTELAGSVLFQGLLADSNSSDPLQEPNSAIDGLTGVAKDEVQDLFVGLFEGMNPVSSEFPPSLHPKLDNGAYVQASAAVPEVPKTGGTQSSALLTWRPWPAVYEQKLEEAKVSLLQSIGVGSKGPLDEYSPDWKQVPKFDMSLAAVMANYAFESYNYPVDGRWEEHLDGTRT